MAQAASVLLEAHNSPYFTEAKLRYIVFIVATRTLLSSCLLYTSLTTGGHKQRRALAWVTHGSCFVLTVVFYDFAIVSGQKLESILP